jgi:hypothetical protein
MPADQFRRCSAAVLAALLAPACLAVPVIPGAAGYGIETPAGRGGTVYRVTNLNATGSGSLAACVQATGPRVCVFEIAGTINGTGTLTAHSPFLTIAGQTAPSPGITLRNLQLVVSTSDVLIQHIRFRVGDDPNGPLASDRDNLTIWAPASSPARRIVVDHCSFSWSVDELVSAWDNWDEITYRNNIFAEPLNDSLHPKGSHGFGPIFGGTNAGSVSVIGNLFAHIAYRNPHSTARNLVYVNNIVYNRVNADISLEKASDGSATNNTVVGNSFIRGPNYGWNSAPVLLDGTADHVTAGTRVFLRDNTSTEGYGSQSAFLGDPAGAASRYVAAAAPAWVEGLVALPTAGNVAYNWVLASAGARPSDRDTVDRRIVNNVKSRNGQTINLSLIHI